MLRWGKGFGDQTPMFDALLFVVGIADNFPENGGQEDDRCLNFSQK
jgi:hypothetical protein